MLIDNAERFAGAVCLLCLAWTGGGHGAEARQSVPAETISAEVTLIDAPVPPTAPATINRDEEGRATLRAVRLDEPLTLDGSLDEAVYQSVPAAGGFIQITPDEGAPATEPTEVWLFFDDRNLYISVFCHDSHPEREIASELRHDGPGISQEDNVAIALDTFYDRRNGFYFQTNPVGGFREQAITDGVSNNNWNTVWDVKTTRRDDGYTFEMAIPFKSLRYRAAGLQTWGIQIRRIVKWKNELSYLNPVPVPYDSRGILQMWAAAALVGVETPSQSMNLEVKPYVLSALNTDLAPSVPFSNDATLDAGFDFKYGLTRSLTADVTVNTDFAQVEEDVQQVNLTRFSLFFPEKRDFFLEGQGLFGFAGQGTGGRFDGASAVPTMFFSRRIGLSNGQPVPVVAGARVSGRIGPFEVGLLNIQSGDDATAGAVSTNFSVARVRRNILRRSNVGVIATARRPATGGAGTNGAFGIDSNLRFFDNIESNVHWAKTATPGLQGDDSSYRGRFEYGADRYGFEVEHLLIGANFNPEIGFVRRKDLRRSLAEARFSPRLLGHPVIRQLRWTVNLEYETDAAVTRLENRNVAGSFGVDFNSGDVLRTSYRGQYEFLPQAFDIAPDVTVPSGRFDSYDVEGSYELGQQREVSGTVSASRGTLYGGTKTTAGFRGRLGFSSRFVVEPSTSFNWVDLPSGNFTVHLAGARIIITPTARLLFSSLIQLNPSARSLTSSARMRWEYVPGSELFVVYSDGRNTRGPGYPDLVNRSLAVKITRLFRL